MIVHNSQRSGRHRGKKRAEGWSFSHCNRRELNGVDCEGWKAEENSSGI